MGRIVAIHQPNFFPWLGYFSKMVRSDVFIFLDDVQFSKTGGTWSNRVKVLVADNPKWVTAAIDRNYHGTRKICEMAYLTENPWRETLLKTLNTSYRRHPYYAESMAVLEPLILNPETSVADYNIHAITTIASRLGVVIEQSRRSSRLPHDGSSNELLCSLTKTVSGDTYLSGGGADGYQDESVFTARGVTLQPQCFVHPVYPQHRRTEFTVGLSVIDAAMNLGWLGAGRLVKNN